MTNRLHILLIGNNTSNFKKLLNQLSDDDYQVSFHSVISAKEMQTAFAEESFDTIISDFQLEGFSAPAALELSKEFNPNIPFIIISDKAENQTAIKLLRAGAKDFLLKVNLSMLPIIVRRELLVIKNKAELEKREKEILKSQANFEHAQKIANVGSWEHNFSTDELSWSKECYKIFELQGTTPETLYDNFIQSVHPADLERFLSTVRETLDASMGYKIEYRIITPNGHLKYLDCNAETVNNDDGFYVGMKGTCQDITKRKKIEFLLKKQEQNTLLLQHAEQVPGIIYQYKIHPDGSTSYPFLSRGIEDLFELTAEEVMEDNSKILLYLHPEDLKAFQNALNISEQSLDNWALDFRVILPIKGLRWLRGNSKPHKSPDGSVVWHGYITDITEQKKADSALISSQKQVSTIFKSAPNAIIIIDIEGKITKWNPKAEAIFGWIEEEVLGTFLDDILLPLRDRKKSLSGIQYYIKTGEDKVLNKTLELSAVDKNNTEFTISLAISEITISNQQFFICFINDITNRKNTEKKVQQSLREKEVLLKEIHHRVKNNMQVITSLLSLQSSFIEEIKIKNIFSSTQYRINSMGMVHEMLYQSKNLSNIDYGRYLERLISSLIEIMKGYDNSISLNLEAPNISLNVDTAIPLGLIVNEIITNSLKYGFTSQKEPIITIKLIALDYPNFRLEIGDNGIGFPKEFNINKSNSLGLRLIHKLAIQLNGKIERLKNKKGTNYLLLFQEIDQF
jgi:PAS domain S-box-containing protein